MHPHQPGEHPPPEGVDLPITDPGEAWHLAALATLRSMADAYRNLQLMLPGSTTEAAAELANEYLHHLDALAEKHWQAYVASASRTPYERETLLACGEPFAIALSPKERLPVATWKLSTQAATDMWGFMKIASDNSPELPPIDLSTPFRMVDPDRLEGVTNVIEITDAGHTALAATAELLATASRDLQRIYQSLPLAEAWSGCQVQASFYLRASRTAINALPPDHLRGWKIPRLRTMMPTAVPQAVEDIALTTRAHQAIAFHLVARAYGEMLDQAEEASPGDRAGAFAAVRAAIDRELSTLIDGVSARNDALLRANGMDPSIHVATLIFRALNRPLPVLAVGPRSALPPVIPLRS